MLGAHELAAIEDDDEDELLDAAADVLENVEEAVVEEADDCRPSAATSTPLTVAERLAAYKAKRTNARGQYVCRKSHLSAEERDALQPARSAQEREELKARREKVHMLLKRNKWAVTYQLQLDRVLETWKSFARVGLGRAPGHECAWDDVKDSEDDLFEFARTLYEEKKPSAGGGQVRRYGYKTLRNTIRRCCLTRSRTCTTLPS
ncbi:uncharacterized protein EV422DRAFT_381463 [Fimicolochytrium jonesii]|uniref:uncharacterized protein n=1 Tax=Fimicolochytrium jonesii TaxID=1396493 RepID=UPI0022FE4739|nr:uncharacterized protein EV422DRAFT_381463 [Fimicolochytrium jonesii]KAI8822861.1 hypothetical protein EV422DRAFT_381463 [Fimicolochytrium jonesii]